MRPRGRRTRMRAPCIEADFHPENIVSRHNVVLLANARRAREDAARARRLSVWVGDNGAIQRLVDYSIERDRHASEYEQLAAKLKETMLRTQAAIRELRAVIAETRRIVEEEKARR